MKMSIVKFRGVIPAFYACYDNEGNISKQRTEKLVQYYIDKGVQGLYVGGSSGECIYHTLEERKATLQYVAEAAKGKLTLIAHVGAPATEHSVMLAKHAEALQYDALSSIPPIYFILSEKAIEAYWTEMIEATALPFIIYNIPQTTGYQLSMGLFEKMLEHPQVIGVKNSSMPTMDIERFKAVANNKGKEFIVFNGPDEQFVAGRLIGADGGIGGTYGAMPELFLAADQMITEGNIANLRALQTEINDIIVALTSGEGHMYAIIKEVLRHDGIDIGSVRAPLLHTTDNDKLYAKEIYERINRAVRQYASSK